MDSEYERMEMEEFSYEKNKTDETNLEQQFISE